MASEWDESSVEAEVTATAVIVEASTEETVSEAARWTAMTNSVVEMTVEVAVVVVTGAMVEAEENVAASEAPELTRESMLSKRTSMFMNRKPNLRRNKNMTKILMMRLRLRLRKKQSKMPLKSKSRAIILNNLKMILN